MAKIVIDKDTGIETKDDWKTTKDLNALGLETVAIHIAKCEGKDEKVIKEIRKKLKGG